MERVSNSLIDSHCHLDFPQFDEDRNEVIQRAAEAGVGVLLPFARSKLERHSQHAGEEVVAGDSHSVAVRHADGNPDRWRSNCQTVMVRLSAGALG